MSIEGIDRHSIADAVSTHDPACIQSFLEAFSLFLVFSVQTKPNKMLHLNVSRREQQQQHKRLFNAEIHLPNSNWFDRLCFFGR